MTKNRKAVSPVIATVVLVAVAITIAVAVSYWMSGISSQYTQFEKVELTSAYCESTTADWNDTDNDCWNITIDFRNTGTTEATIIGAQVNGKSIADYGYNTTSGGGFEFTDDWIRAYNSSFTQLDFDETGSGNPTTYTVTPGNRGQIVLNLHKDPGTAYDFSSGTTIEIALRSGAGNTYMKMVTLS